MPGFAVTGNEKDSLLPFKKDGKFDWLRNHRFAITEFFNMDVSKNMEFLAVKDISLPDKEIRSFDILTPGTTYKFAKSVSYSDLRINFYGSDKFLTDINKLHDGAHNLEDGIGDFDTYIGQVKFRIFTIADRSGYIEYNYFNAWVSNVTHGQVTYGSSDIKDIGVTIKFSFFEVTRKFGDAEENIVLKDVKGVWNPGSGAQ